ncbi:MAG: sugar ABC transporter permease [Actinobacteria bacterium]|nr:sugar ABC transporter permease [Actinomycetota bacterium]
MTTTAESDLRAPVSARGRQRALTPEGARSEHRLAALLCAPAVLVILVVTAYPIGYAIYLSLRRLDLRFSEQGSFIGLANYGSVLTADHWWQAFTATLIITVVSVTIEFVIGLALALAMYRTMIGRGLVRTVVLIPYCIVTVVAAVSWQYAWTPNKGYLAALLPLDTAPLADQASAMAVIILAEVWKTTPFMALLLLMGLVLVPDELLRAAQIDGAGPWKRLTKIILPMMKPVILVALLFRTLDAFRIFDSIYVLTNGSNGTASVSMLGYDNLFKVLNLGIGSAISVLIFIVASIFAYTFIRLFGVAAPGAEADGERRL